MLTNADNAYGFKRPYMYGADSSDDQEDLYGLKTKPDTTTKPVPKNEDNVSNASNLSDSKKLGIS